MRATEAYVKLEYPLSEITSRIIAAATLVHRNLGPGFEEVIYQRALALELQALSYLKASGYKVGLLLNFGASRLQIRRLAN